MSLKVIRWTTHVFTPWGKKVHIPWPYCRRCGLIYLRNDITLRAVRRGCPVYEGDE